VGESKPRKALWREGVQGKKIWDIRNIKVEVEGKKLSRPQKRKGGSHKKRVASKEKRVIRIKGGRKDYLRL